MSMKWARKNRYFNAAFTIVELMIVVAVLAILAGITTVSYGSWQTRLAQNSVQADLKSAAAALEQAKNFGSGYPLAVPSSFKSGDSVAIAGGGSSDGSSFCLQGGSTKVADVTYYLDGINKSPQAGSCPTQGLVGWWPLDGSVNDLSGSGNNGTAYSITSAVGQDGDANTAYSFTGINSYILHTTNNINPTSGTISVWVNPTVQNGWGIWQTHNSTSVNFADWIAVFPYSAGPLYFRFGNGTSCCTDLTYTTASYVPVGQWTYLAFTWGAGTMQNYVNGNLINQRSATFPSTIDPYARIGTGHAAGMQGRMDDIRIYNRPLSQLEIQALYNLGAQ